MTSSNRRGSARLRFVRWASFALLALMAVFALPQPAKAWWNDDWSYRKKITIDASAKGAALAADAGTIPVLIRLSDGNFKFDGTKDDGSDIRFVAGDDKTPLKFHIEKFDPVLGMAFIWVQVPDVKAGATTDLWMYYGNPKAPVGGDAKGTYDADQTLVYHFAEHNAPPHDQTAYNNNATTPDHSDQGSFIGDGIKLDGTAPITLPASPSLAIADGGALTWSAWIKLDTPQETSVLYAKQDGGKSFALGFVQGVPYVAISDGTNTFRTAATDPIDVGHWHHLAVTVSDHITIYVDGQPKTQLAAHLPAIAGAAVLGAASMGPAAPGAAPAGTAPAASPAPTPAPDATPAPGTPAPTAAATPDTLLAAPPFVGELDELELAKVARGQGWITAAVASQGTDAKLVVYGGDEQNASWSTGYFGVILKSVTIDGWVVIGILGIMAAVSWAVMITKALFLRRQSRANSRFLDAFAGHGAEFDAFDAYLSENDPQPLEASSLYRIYCLGQDERRRRATHEETDEDSLPPHIYLSERAIAAIRAVLDGVATREGQRLNSLMVLLTIAISGGPFLGLLGTVVGVMITFAAIAATGDVNINAIAPGIAAALVATVAGLGVAIPALFGYNYLITQIKDLSADMAVFIDEFSTRLAEIGDADADHQELAAD